MGIPFQDPLSKPLQGLQFQSNEFSFPLPFVGSLLQARLLVGKLFYHPPPFGHWSVLTNIIIIPLTASNPKLIDLITCPLGIQIRDRVILMLFILSLLNRDILTDPTE